MIDYGSMIESWIRRIDERLSGEPNPEMDKSLAKEVVSVFSGEIEGIKNGLDRHQGRINLGGTASKIDDRGDLKKLKGKLEMLLAKHIEKRSSCAHDVRGADSMPVINIVEANPQISVTSSSTTTVSNDIKVEPVVVMIDADDNLSCKEKNELKSLLKDAESEEAKNDSGVFARIGAKILEGLENATPSVVSGVIGHLASLAAAHFGM